MEMVSGLAGGLLEKSVVGKSVFAGGDPNCNQIGPKKKWEAISKTELESNGGPAAKIAKSDCNLDRRRPPSTLLYRWFFAWPPFFAAARVAAGR